MENARSGVPLLPDPRLSPSCLKSSAALGGLNPARNGEEKQPPELALSGVVLFENSCFAPPLGISCPFCWALTDALLDLSLGIIRNI